MSRHRPSPRHRARKPLPTPHAAAPPATVSRDALPSAPSAASSAEPSAGTSASPGAASPRAAGDPRLNALKHGAFAQNLVQTAAPLGENPAEFAALLDALTARYAPRGLEERVIVERLASLWWRLMRLGRHVGPVLTDWLRRGNDYLEALERIESLAPAEARLERSIAHGRRQLAFLQRMRLGRDPVWDEAPAIPGEPWEGSGPDVAAEMPAPSEPAPPEAAPLAAQSDSAAPAPVTVPEDERMPEEKPDAPGVDESGGTPEPAPEAAPVDGPLAEVLRAARAAATHLTGDALFEASYQRLMGRPWTGTIPGASTR